MIRRIPLWGWALGIGAIALALRLTGLGLPNTLVFDEVYYVPFALNYLQGQPSFDAHPPLAKYLLALGIWLGQWPAAWLGWPTVAVAGNLVSPLAFRWLNALVGSTIPILLAALAFSLSHEYLPQRRRSFALLAGLMMAMEGLTLVESRLALINIYGLALGLLGQWAWVRAGQAKHPARWRWVAGIALGAAVNVKWNWAGLWLGLLLWEVLTSYREYSGSPLPKSLSPRERGFETSSSSPSPPGRRGWGMRANPWRRRVAYLGVIPLATYLLLWLPHLMMTGESLVGVHQRLWSTHQSIGANGSHAYCSPWHSWPLMARPVAYFYERADGMARTIHAMGNPVLWWLGTAAVLSLALGWLARRIAFLGWAKDFALAHRRGMMGTPALPILRSRSQRDGVVPFILLNYLANWLPWALVSRCTFLYHAMGIAAVSTLGLAWLMAKWWGNPQHRPLAMLLLGAIALSFWFWLPLYLGLPLPLDSLHRRWLLPGWI